MLGIWRKLCALFQLGFPVGRPRQNRPSSSSSPKILSSQDPYLSEELPEIKDEGLQIPLFRSQRFNFANRNIIPPSSDKNAALVGQALVTSGYLSKEQLAEIQEVGDRWLRYHDSQVYAAFHSQKAAQDAIEELRENRQNEKAQKKQIAAQRKIERSAAISRRKTEDITFLGSGVSAWLADRRSDLEVLKSNNLPSLSTPAEVASALGLSTSTLRWLCFHSEAANQVHYSNFEIPKRSGGKRLLSAPHKTLASAQDWILNNILEVLPVENSAHGFIKERSILTNAVPHLQKKLVVNFDLKDFFPSITFPRIRGVFHRLGYSPAVSTVLALLCSEAPRQKVEYNGKVFFVATGPRSLPQGACTSPALSNQVARKLDRRLKGMVALSQWDYTRYADDLTFSTNCVCQNSLGGILAKIHHIVKEEGFLLNAKKQRLQRPSGRQTVTGIIVNQKPGIGRKETRRLRAILHAAKINGLGSQNRENVPYFEAWLRGKIAYLYMIDQKKGALMLQQFDAIRQQEKR